MNRSRPWWRTCLLVLWAMVAIMGLLPAGWTARSWVVEPSSTDRLVAQGHRLSQLTAAGSGAPSEMQAVFPEGEFFTYALAGISLARLADQDRYPGVDETTRGSFLASARQILASVDSESVSARFGGIGSLEHGIFYRGWRLQLVNAIVAAGGTDLVGEQEDEARAILRAVADSQAGWVESYPGSYWPCDTVVGLAAAADALPDAAAPVVQRWLGEIDVAGELLPHQVRADGGTIAATRGSSQTIIQTFWPSLLAVAKPDSANGKWAEFTRRFVGGELGVVAAREWPKGMDGPGDIDSGPLVVGFSFSASAVGLAAARANGDTSLASAFDHEIEWLALGVTINGERTYGAGLLPVAEAFIAWSKTTPLGAPPTSASGEAPMWWAWSLLFALPALLFVAFALRRRARRLPR